MRRGTGWEPAWERGIGASHGKRGMAGSVPWESRTPMPNPSHTAMWESRLLLYMRHGGSLSYVYTACWEFREPGHLDLGAAGRWVGWLELGIWDLGLAPKIPPLLSFSPSVLHSYSPTPTLPRISLPKHLHPSSPSVQLHTSTHRLPFYPLPPHLSDLPTSLRSSYSVYRAFPECVLCLSLVLSALGEETALILGVFLAGDLDVSLIVLKSAGICLGVFLGFLLCVYV